MLIATLMITCLSTIGNADEIAKMIAVGKIKKEDAAALDQSGYSSM